MAAEAAETEDEEDSDDPEMELLASSRGGRRSFSERKLISDMAGHGGSPQKEPLLIDANQFDKGKKYELFSF